MNTVIEVPAPAATDGPAPPAARRPAIILPVVILLGAAALRIWDLGGPSIWYDEAVTILLAAQPPAEIVRRTAEDTLPPLSYLLLHPWLALGEHELLWRYPSFCFGLLTVALTARLGHQLGGPRTGYLAGAAIAVSPFFVYYSQEVRLYALLGATLAGYLVLTLRAPSRGRLIFAGALGAAALYTHPLAGLVLALPPLDRLLRSRGREIKAVIPLVIASVAFLPWLSVLVGQTGRVMTTFWAEPVSPLRPLVSFVIFAFGPPANAAQLVGGVALIVLLAGLWVLQARRRAADHGWGSSAAVALVPPLALIALSQVRPIYLDRVLIGAGIAALATLAVWLAALPVALQRTLLVAWIALAAVGLANWPLAPTLGKPDVRAAARWLGEQARPGDLVLHTSDGSHHPFRLYAPDLENRLLAGDPEYAARSPRGVWTERVLEYPTDELGTIAAAGNHVWVVALLDHSVEWQVAQVAALDSQRSRGEERRFGHITVREYLPRPLDAR